MQVPVISAPLRRRALLTAGGIVLVLAGVWFASRIPRTIAVFLIAATIAFALAPVVAYLERRMPRAVAIGAVYVGLIVTAIILSLAVIPETLRQVQNVAINAPDYIDAVQGWIDHAQGFLADHIGKSYLPTGYNDIHGLVAARVSFALATIVESLSNILIGTFTATFVGISALVLSAFFLLRGDTVADSWYALLPGSRRSTARALGEELAQVFGKYVTGQIALCTITGVLIFVFTLLAGFKFALLLGIVGGIAYAVPFLGMIVAHVLGLVLAAPQGVSTVLWVQAIVFTVARVSDNVLVPKIMSESVGVSPILVMFAVFAGGELFGLPGLLLGIPAAALAKVVWRFFQAERKAGAFAPLPVPEVTVTGPLI